MGTAPKMYFYLLLIVFICDGFKVHGPPGPLIVRLGDSVMLPCFVETPLLLEDLKVEWKRIDSETLVHWWQNGESRPKSQNQSYHERANFFTEEIAHGNFSLLLTNVTSKDAGVYKCAVYTKLDSGETLIEIKEIGLSFLHIAILILCILGVVIGSLILGSLSYTSYKKEEDSSRRALAIQCAHVLCPNITMSIVFILWGFTDGYFTEAATCSALNFARILFLLWIALDLKTFPDFPKRLITNLAILLQYTVITVAAYSSIFVDIYYRFSTEVKVALIIVLLLLLIPLLGLIAVVCCKRTTEIDTFRIYMITELSDILRISFFTLGLQRSVIGALFPLFIVVLFYFHAFFTFLRDLFLILLLLLLEFGRASGSIYIHYNLDIDVKERDALVCGTVFLQVLSLVTLFTRLKDSKATQRGHLVVFMFGTVGVVFVNAVVLSVELILTARNGERTVDLRLILLPTESVFAACYLALLISTFCKFTSCSSDEHELENLASVLQPSGS
ncbi:uncharacterized protein LOC113650976 isoform X2 [Tachysurus fulvidraco]|uniref:uncharacterized protein LOC113650976 isoform X2 n=1 Tax=Tachysurus fulvidraco TaxID=1234273 RepID=UPI001FF0394E|nr:uncharacterized protein LOC113650976 isoform X2 [Tachysurus fulvidraco]